MEGTGKKILLTGGTQGIGVKTLDLLLEKGYEVHITYRSSKGVAEEYEKNFPGRVFAYQLDQGIIENIEKADWLNDHSWDGVIFNAALGSGTVLAYSDDAASNDFKKDQAMMDVNALGPLFIYKKIQENITNSNKQCKLVFMSSVGGGLAAFPYFTLSDGMSKAAVKFLSQQLAAEHTHTLVDVFCLCPGATETPMFTSSTLSKMTDEERRDFENHQAKKRLIQPEEIAYWIAQLLLPESTVLHGSVIDASMGLASRPGIMTEA